MTLEFTDEAGNIRPVITRDRRPAGQEKIQPLQLGDSVPFFRLVSTAEGWQTAAQWPTPAGQTTTSLPDLIAREPVVISFYCPCWGSYARPYLEALVNLSATLRQEGITLLVFSNESERSLARQVDLTNLTIVSDETFNVARQFGVYSEDDPIWDRISGISEDVFTPALYVVDTSRRISYRFLDENFEGPFAATDVVDAVTSLRVLA